METTNIQSNEQRLTEAEAAKYIGAKQETLTKWRYRGTGPAFLKLCGKIRYQISDLDAFIQASRHIPERRRAKRRYVRKAKGQTKCRARSAA
jgi:hypothetical protein